jgi:polyisoprenyl-phosphate glycosyltransferase
VTTDKSEKTDAISIVIPVYNSEEIVDELYRRLTKALGLITTNYEIIYVNDCSPDNSWEKISRIAESDNHIKAILLRKNVGYDNALMAGLRYAGKTYVVIMDDDLQYAPEDIQYLLKYIKKGYDVVYGDLLNKRDSITKKLGSWFNGKIARIILKKPANIYLSPFKIFRNEIAHEIIKYDGPFPYIDGLIFQVTSSIDQVIVSHFKRASGSGGHGLFRSLRIMMNFCTTFSILPLRISTVTGFIISLVAFSFSITLIVWKLWFNIDVEGWASIMLGILGMGGIQLMSLGILGEYIGRAYLNINRKPQYVIKDRLNASSPCPGQKQQ